MSDQDTRDKRRQKRERKNAARHTPSTTGARLRHELHMEETQHDSHMSDDLFHDPSDPFEELDFHDYEYEDEIAYRRRHEGTSE